MRRINHLFILLLLYLNCENNPISTLDCNGIEYGLSIEDNCGICDEDPTNDCTQDCSGIWGGSNIYDECGVCGGNGKLNCDDGCILPDENGNYIDDEVDCFGVCGGNAIIDECLICNGPGSVYECGCNGIEQGKCDCDGEIFGCDGECGSGKIEDCNGLCIGEEGFTGDINDECGVCGGSGPEPNLDCNGNCIADFDECGICGGDNSSCSSVNFDACTMPINHLHMEEGSVFYNVDFDFGGFQFNIDGTNVTNYSGGDAVVNGFMISVGGNTVIAFSLTGNVIPSGCGLLTELTLENNNAANGLSSMIFAVGTNGLETQILNYYTGP